MKTILIILWCINACGSALGGCMIIRQVFIEGFKYDAALKIGALFIAFASILLSLVIILSFKKS